ncbi:phosphoribosylamine--glycine ligase [Salsuginibacillus kocurii]|uniref:phosphoribosylamine--glycine ligase n=1 Tax=Salsuginibacillus kocurii TaxID=427078 RepID=UPI000378D59F|nr:phosphoribosylamine--glycine ligase [Salsuginibacillus kocurii]
MNILVVGSGGREHAVAAKLAEGKARVAVAPGNPGMKDVAMILDIKETDHEGLIQAARELEADLVVIGPEAPLLNGLADDFKAAGFRVFGPDQKAAEIEGSKSFAKNIMEQYQIPTGSYYVTTSYDEAVQHVQNQGAPIVIKADGLAAGKGVTVAMTFEEAEEALADVLLDGKFGEAGAQVVIEEYLEGEELSLMALVHGETVVPLVGAQDHKRAYDADQGPNTGGMGAYSPVPQFTSADVDEAVERVLKPTAQAMVKEGRPFTGVLYAGLMMTTEGPKVIEFNARFGDPEAQVVLPRLTSDLAEVLSELVAGGEPQLEWSDDAVVGVVLAAEGYPASYQKGISVSHLQFSRQTSVYWAGVKTEEDDLVTAGGRVVLVAERAEDLKTAQQKVYDQLQEKTTTGLFYRTDIGDKAIKNASS